MNYSQKIDQAAKRIIEVYGECPEETITIYTITQSKARSNMSGVYTALLIIDNRPHYLCCDVRVSGCGLDRRFELAYVIFCKAYGYNNPKVKYQKRLNHQSLN